MKNLLGLFLVLVSPQILSLTFIKVSCTEIKDKMCSDSSVLTIYSKRFKRECESRKGTFKVNSQCDRSKYLSSFCGIKDHHFQLYFSKKFYSPEEAKRYCLKQRVGAHALSWQNLHSL